MNRTNWMIAGGVALALLLAGGVAVMQRAVQQPKMMSGPGAIVHKDAPKHGRMGVEFDPMATTPLTIRHVVKGSAADETGLQAGDVIVAFNEKERMDLSTFQELIRSTEPGDRITVRIRRGKDELERRVRLMSLVEMVLLEEAENRDKAIP
jgi:S1-C subfamily serine protease